MGETSQNKTGLLAYSAPTARLSAWLACSTTRGEPCAGLSIRGPRKVYKYCCNDIFFHLGGNLGAAYDARHRPNGAVHGSLEVLELFLHQQTGNLRKVRRSRWGGQQYMSIAAGKWGSKRAEGKNGRPRRQTSASGQRTTLRMENIETWVGVCREVFTPDTASTRTHVCTKWYDFMHVRV